MKAAMRMNSIKTPNSSGLKRGETHKFKQQVESLGPPQPQPTIEKIEVPDVSIDCLDALELLLKKDPRERITIFDFLHHPWLQNYQKWKNRKMWAGTYSSDESGSLRDELSDQDDDILARTGGNDMVTITSGQAEEPFVFGSPQPISKKLALVNQQSSVETKRVKVTKKKIDLQQQTIEERKAAVSQ